MPGPIRALLIASLLVMAGPALAQSRAAMRGPPAASAAEAAQAQARIEAARHVQEVEALYDAALERERNAAAAAQMAEAEAEARARTLAAMLPVLRRLALYPAETLLALPTSPEEALRGTLVLRSLARHLREEAEHLREARALAAENLALAAREAAHLAPIREAAREAARQLDAELAARPRPPAGRGAERAQQAATRSADLPEMFARLPPSATPPRAEQPPPSGLAALPVAGRIARDFAAPTEAGPARGLTIAAPPGARVTAPCAGQVAFAGAFRSYGQLVILDCGEGLHAVLAGLARLHLGTGERAELGEPVGVLGEPDARTGRAALYFELRRNGVPMDPRPWLAPRA